MSEAFDLPHLRSWIGREDVAEDVISVSLVERFNATIGLPHASAKNGDGAPALIHFCLFLPSVPMARLGADGHPARGDFLPPVPLPRRMWAGSSIAFHAELRIGQALQRRSRVAGVTFKQGRSGGLCFVTVEHDIRSDGVTLLSEEQTIVYRDAGDAAPAAMAGPAPMGAAAETVEMSPALLFRYSALTFNSHRIHYDLPYATREEGYSGLVVQGPLQATLLIHLAARRRGGKVPDRFTFRGQSPALGGEPLGLNAEPVAGDAQQLWTSRPDGSIAMKAVAEWR